nr:hypothetical protein [Nocardioides sp. URHA0020]
MGDLHDPTPLDDVAAGCPELSHQGVEDVHRIELGLVGQHDRSDVQEGHRQPFVPPHLEPEGRRRLQLRPCVADSRAGVGRVGDGIAGLHGDAVALAEAEQPRLALTVGPHVALDHGT